MFDISDAQKHVLKIWLIIGIIILAVSVLLAIILKKETVNEPNITSDESSMLIDRNRYYTIKTAILKYYAYLNMRDKAAILDILDSEYKKQNGITEDNLWEVLDISDKQLSYDSKVICLKNTNAGVYRFVVAGNQVLANKGTTVKPEYYEVMLDGNTSLFSLKIIEESNYNEVCNEKK